MSEQEFNLNLAVVCELQKQIADLKSENILLRDKLGLVQEIGSLQYGQLEFLLE